MATPASSASKRARVDTESYTADRPDPGVGAKSKSMTSPITSCAQAVLLMMLDFSTLPELANVKRTCRHFRAIIDSDPVELLVCNLLGIIPTLNRRINQNRMMLLEGAINGPLRVYESNSPASQAYYALPENQFIKRAWDLMKIRKSKRVEDPAAPLLSSVIPMLTLAARPMQTALHIDELLNPGLRQRVGQSPPQDAVLPFLLLTEGGFDMAAQLTTICKLSPLLFQIALNQLDVHTCALLANVYREMPRPDLRLLQDLFTDALTPGKGVVKITPEKVMIFHAIGARPGPRSLECVVDRNFNADPNPNTLALFNTLLGLGAPLTSSLFEKILPSHDTSVFDIARLEKLLTRFKHENKLELLPTSFLDAALDGSLKRLSLGDYAARIALLLRLGCNPSVDTLILWRRSYSMLSKEVITRHGIDRLLHDPIFAQCSNKVRHEFFMRCLGNKTLFKLISTDDMREIHEMKLKPTTVTIRIFYQHLGCCLPEGEVSRSIQRWLETYKYTLRTGTLEASLLGGGHCHRTFQLDRVFKFYSLGIDSPIIPNRPIALLLYFIQMEKMAIKMDELHDLKNRIIGREWLKKHGFELDFNTGEDFEKLLKELIELYIASQRVLVVPFVLSILEKTGYEPTREAIDNVFANVPGILRHPDYRDFLNRKGLLFTTPLPAAPTDLAALPAPVSLRSLPAAPPPAP